MRRRGEWFERMRDAYLVLWWVPAGHRPTIEEAKQKLEHLREHGPTARAFNFRNPFAAPDVPDAPVGVVSSSLGQCPAT